jgi:hypothetical protein
VADASSPGASGALSVQAERNIMMDGYELSDALFGRSVVCDGDPTGADGCWAYLPGDDVGPKFDSVAAAIMWTWSLDSTQDEDCGDAQLGNGWHALFRDERAILHTGNSGFVSAWRIENGKDVDTVWAEIEQGARYMDDDTDHDAW